MILEDRGMWTEILKLQFQGIGGVRQLFLRVTDHGAMREKQKIFWSNVLNANTKVIRNREDHRKFLIQKINEYATKSSEMRRSGIYAC